MKRKSIFVCTALFFSLLFCLSAGMLISYHLAEKRHTQEFENLARLVVTEPETEAPETQPSDTTGEAQKDKPETAVARPDYSALYARNPDFVGWLSIEGTGIDYPVMHTPQEPDYYINRGFDKDRSSYGVPFLDGACSLTGDNLIIYGHHMKNGAMFGALMDYKSKAFYEAHPTIAFDTLDGPGRFQIIAVYLAQVYTTRPGTFFYYLFTEAENAAAFESYVDECQARALYDTGETAIYGDQLLTLSTCEYSQQNGRLIVLAKKIA